MQRYKLSYKSHIIWFESEEWKFLLFSPKTYFKIILQDVEKL